MDQASDHVTLYTAQRDAVVEILQGGRTYYVQKRFIEAKYGQVSQVFTTVYGWYTRHAAALVPKPTQAESAVWAFADPMDAAAYAGSRLLTLRVPVEEAVFFDMLEWTELLNFQYLGGAEERAAFQKKLADQGVTDSMKIMTTGFYPLLKRELTASWSALLRHDAAIKAGQDHGVSHIQAGLWKIEPDWVVSIA